MFYGGSVSPPREPVKKKRVIPRRTTTEKKMGDNGTSGSGNHGVRESSVVWPMLNQMSLGMD